MWDGNTILHEYLSQDNSNTLENSVENASQPEDEIADNLVTWVFNDGFVPSAKITSEGNYSIISDYLGTPVEAYDEQGHKVWSAELDVYGRVKEFTGEKDFIPFRYQGQYEDIEIGLYYNRFRYYDPEQGNYTQIDPIGLAGGNPTLYGYVYNPNSWIDPFGLANEFQIAPYGDITGPKHIGDNLTGRELLQSAWLRQNHGITRSSNIGKLNPSIALTEPNMHKNITALQNHYNMKGMKLKGQSALQNINRNSALTRRGIYEGLLERGWEHLNAKRYANELTMKLRGDAINFAKKQGYIKCP
ncbi:RHS domain-containing protein [Lysinibacillus sp. JNUCC-52]|nr:RHS domain-containing protein [Lysinibacillus sp. JNUCC-52]